MNNRTGKLSPEEYQTVCALTQMVSIDLLVSNRKGKYLLGKRLNSPAKGMYFVPGSRVHKGESLSNALDRVSVFELGVKLTNWSLHGVYEHYYPDDNPSGVDGISAHYVVFAFVGDLPDGVELSQFASQHSDIKWLTCDEILAEKHNVHDYTRAYFLNKSYNRFLSGSIIPDKHMPLLRSDGITTGGMVLEGYLPENLDPSTPYPGSDAIQYEKI